MSSKWNRRRFIRNAAGLLVPLVPGMSSAMGLVVSSGSKLHGWTPPEDGGEDPGGGELAFPAGFNDPVFDDVSNSGAFNTTSGGGPYNDLSINQSTSSWSIGLFHTSTFNRIRMISNEGFRFATDGTVVLNWVYNETFMNPGDHADGIQMFDPGGVGTFEAHNCHFRLDEGHCAIFAADDWAGHVHLEDCLFSCNASNQSQFGLRLHDDGHPSGPLTLAVRNCYFQEDGWSNDAIFVNLSGFEVTITEWTNVRWCDWNHSTGELTPGDLIPQPS